MGLNATQNMVDLGEGALITCSSSLARWSVVFDHAIDIDHDALLDIL